MQPAFQDKMIVNVKTTKSSTPDMIDLTKMINEKAAPSSLTGKSTDDGVPK